MRLLIANGIKFLKFSALLIFLSGFNTASADWSRKIVKDDFTDKITMVMYTPSTQSDATLVLACYENALNIKIHWGQEYIGETVLPKLTYRIDNQESESLFYTGTLDLNESYFGNPRKMYEKLISGNSLTARVKDFRLNDLPIAKFDIAGLESMYMDSCSNYEYYKNDPIRGRIFPEHLFSVVDQKRDVMIRVSCEKNKTTANILPADYAEKYFIINEKIIATASSNQMPVNLSMSLPGKSYKINNPIKLLRFAEKNNGVFQIDVRHKEVEKKYSFEIINIKDKFKAINRLCEWEF